MKIKHLLLFLLFTFGLNAQSIQQKLTVIQNDHVQGGIFKIGVDIQGINLPTARTICSFTIDLFIDNSVLAYENASGWKFGYSFGYDRFVSNVDNIVRVGCTSMGVNADGNGVPPGYDIQNDIYDRWVELTFRILNSQQDANITIDPLTNSISIYTNPQNNPNNGENSHPTLLTPIVIGNIPLPVELISFSGLNVDKGIQLNWSTATESNNYGFDIERRINSDEQNNWTKIGFVNGSGSSNSIKKYTYIDNDILNDVYFYRLKQIDNNGSFTYSQEVMVNNTTIPEIVELLQNYPNPFNPSTTITFALPNESNVKINLYNSLGEKIKKIVEGNFSSGMHKINFNAEDLSTGTYFYTLELNNVRLSKKLTLIK